MISNLDQKAEKQPYASAESKTSDVEHRRLSGEFVDLSKFRYSNQAKDKELAFPFPVANLIHPAFEPNIKGLMGDTSDAA